MARRAVNTVWASAAVGAGDESPAAYVGEASTVALLVSNEGGTPTNITVQVAVPVSRSAGRNAAPDGADANWFDYGSFTAVAVAAGARVAIDLSPFAPPYVRLRSSAATTLTARVASLGGD
jgi:hypothetical protein